MSITRDFDILFLVCNSYLVIRVSQFWQATLRTVMNTSIHMILETLCRSQNLSQFYFYINFELNFINKFQTRLHLILLAHLYLLSLSSYYFVLFLFYFYYFILFYFFFSSFFPFFLFFSFFYFHLILFPFSTFSLLSPLSYTYPHTLTHTPHVQDPYL